MTKLEAMAKTSKTFTNLMDGSVLPSASVIAIINYYEYLLDTNPAEVKYISMSNIEKNFALQEAEELFNRADYLDEDEQFKW